MEGTRTAEEILRSEDLEVRTSDGLVLACGRAVSLSPYELRLLIALMRRQGRIVPRAELYELAWGETLRDGDRTVDVYVHKLRSKLERACPERQFIHTHIGFGYRLAPEPSRGFHSHATTP